MSRLSLRPALRRYAHSVAPVAAGIGPLYDNLVAWWSLDEAYGNRADSIGSHTLIDINTVGSDIGQVYALAAAFDNNAAEYLYCDSTDDLDMGDRDFAVAAWVYPTKAITGMIVAKTAEANANTWSYALRQESLNMRFYIGSGSAWTSVIKASAGYNVWQLVFFYHDSVNNQIGISVNAGAAQTAAWAGGSYSHSRPLGIGSRCPFDEFFAAGRIGPVMIWRDYIPTTDEVTWLYNAGAGRALAELGEATGTGGAPAYDAAWTWFTNPRSVHHVGTNDRTYIGYTNSIGQVGVLTYDHTAGAIDSNCILRGFGIAQADDHNNASLLVRSSDAKIMAYYAKHNDNTIRLRVSSAAEDAGAFDVEVSLDAQLGGTSYSYPCPVQLTGETDDPIYLFYRDYGVGLMMSKSTDGGATWVAQTTLFQQTGHRPYFQIVQNSDDRIDFAVTNGHPGEYATNSLYHFYYQGGNYYKSDGTLIGDASALPVTSATATLVYDGTTSRCWVWDIAIDAGGHPVIVYANFVGGYADHRYRYARWTGTSWDDHEITAAGTYLYAAEPYYSGGICLDQADPNICYLSKQISGQWEIYKYVTADGGATWTPTAITSGSTEKQIRPVVPRNAHATKLQVLWLAGTYTSFISYDMRVRGYPPGILD